MYELHNDQLNIYLELIVISKKNYNQQQLCDYIQEIDLPNKYIVLITTSDQEKSGLSLISHNYLSPKNILSMIIYYK